jgi:hypothetical protein
MRDLNNRKARNILELKVNEIVADAVKGVILLEALNSPSPRSSSFTNLAVREESTDSFFRLLDSPGRNAEMP